MNENLARLKALVTETNEVVANLNKETEDIKGSNQEERAHKFAAIREYLLDCYEITREIGKNIKVKLDLADVKRISYDTKVWILFDLSKTSKRPIRFYSEYIDKYGVNSDIDNGFDADTVWKVDSEKQYDIFPYYFSTQNEFDFIDKWDQDEFEKRFAVEVEKLITEKASKANENYQSAVNSKELLRR